MLIDPMYYAVFYDIAFPRNDKYAMRKKINYYKWMNLTDGIGEKQVELDGSKYVIVEMRTFKMLNTVDNTLFLICDVIKIKP